MAFFCSTFGGAGVVGFGGTWLTFTFLVSEGGTGAEAASSNTWTCSGSSSQLGKKLKINMPNPRNT